MFSSIIGQDSLKRQLGRMIRAAQVRRGALPHFALVSGTGGTGKTMTVKAVAAEMKVGFKGILANETTPELLVRAMVASGPNGIVLIDEYNSKNNDLDFFLRVFLEEGRIVINGIDYDSEHKYTIVICSNNPSDEILPQPLKSRLRFFEMEEYNIAELTEIVKLHSKAQGVNLTEDTAKLVASRSRGIPRLIVRMLESIGDEEVVLGRILTHNEIIKVVEDAGFFKSGVNRLDIKIMKLLYKIGEASLSALTKGTNESEENIRTSEGFLIRMGYMTIHGRRKLTAAGFDFVRSLEE